jgi:MFS family permease
VDVTATRSPAATRGLRLAPSAAFVLMGATLGLVLFAASTPSPLYPVYEHRFGFSPVTLTAIFAVYAFALVAALLTTGALSDRVGRRPVLLVSLLLLAAAMAVFALAGGVGWLFAARILQGLGTGVATGTLSAALIDLQPRPGMGPTVSAVAPALGLAVGALATGALVQHGPAPRQLVFWLLVGAFLVTAAALAVVPETVPYSPG